MDSLTHSLVGCAFGRTVFGRYGAWAVPVSVAAANLPDAENLFVPPWGDRALYLLTHRGATHGVLGATVGALVLAAALWATGRALAGRWKEPPPLRSALLVCLAGALSHIFLDWTNSYGLRPLAPFDWTWFYGDLLFIVDPWLWAILIAMGYAGAPPNRLRRLLWAPVIGLALTATVMGASGRMVPLWTPVVFAAALAATVGFHEWRSAAERASGMESGGCPRRALLGYPAIGLLLLLLLVSGRLARERTRAGHPPAPGEAEPVYSLHPAAAQPWRFRVLADRGERIDVFEADVWERSPRLVAQLPTNRDCPAIEEIRDTPQYRAWRAFARHPVVEARGGTIVLGDARYLAVGRHDWSAQAVPLHRRPP